ncbi:6,7-dimethyl-8-ribityllumazine synthase [Candidatus Poriferisodalis sp.]|uniref:6,7-dimethyl-8-ribityllumazine synthase n=1 Tax=Candidatus Poriferisodalis sp. TaxID=3101277 RepID=UPI003AF94E1C
MASGDQRAGRPPPGAGAGLRVGIVRATWNPDIVDRLSDGVGRGLDELGITEVTQVTVPGCFEIPLAAKLLAEAGQVDAIVTIGAVIRGETTHYELVSEGAAQGVMAVQLDTGIPVGFGLVTVENIEQALERSEGPGGHNVGEDAAYVAVTMALLDRNVAADGD